MSITSSTPASTLDLVVFDLPPESMVALSGELDIASAPALTRSMRGLDPSGELITLDLRGLTFMDLAGLRSLLDVRRYARQTGRRLQILGPHAEAARVLELTGTLDLLN